MLSDFYEQSISQGGLFDVEPFDVRSKQLMATVDKINRQKKGQVVFARDGISQSWQMKRENLSPCYTTRWSDLPKVR
jgi:DNA polymerase V